VFRDPARVGLAALARRMLSLVNLCEFLRRGDSPGESAAKS